MNRRPEKLTTAKQRRISEKLAPVYRKIGGFTFAAGLLALLLGLWIDRLLGTQPVLTVGLVAVSAPIVIWLNTRVLKREIAKATEEISQRKNP